MLTTASLTERKYPNFMRFFVNRQVSHTQNNASVVSFLSYARNLKDSSLCSERQIKLRMTESKKKDFLKTSETRLDKWVHAGV